MVGGLVNRKDKVLEALRLGEPDTVPATVLDGGAWTLEASGTDFESLIGHPEEMARVNIETARRMEFPIVYLGSGCNNYPVAALGGTIKFNGVGPPDVEKLLIEDIDEIEHFNVDDLAKDELINTVWEATRVVASELGEEVVVTATSWGPFTLATQMYGLENMMRSMVKRPKDAKKVIQFATRVIARFYQPLLEENLIPLATIADMAASGDLVSRQHFAEFALPYLQMLIADTRSKGAQTLLHICGDTYDKLDLLADTGAGCISIDHKVDIGGAKEILRGRSCLAGNVDPVRVLLQGTPADVEAACRDCLAEGAAGGGFILMPGCDIPPSVPEENLRVFLRTVESYPQGEP